VVLDKTGTVTEGRPVVTEVRSAGRLDEAALLALAAAVERGSEHPLGEAVVRRAGELGVAIPSAGSFTALPGLGVEARVDGRPVILGSAELMSRRGIADGPLMAEAEVLAARGKTPMFVARDGTVEGIVAVADVPRPTSAAAIRKLRDLGLEVVMLTGDNPRTAGAVAGEVGVDRVLAGVLPGGKAEAVRSIQAEGRKVAMVGDGINDAAALAQADVGIAIGSGTDVAIESADVVLMRGDLGDVVGAIALSRAVIRNIRQNLFWAFFYNVIGIPVAAGLLHLFGGPLLNPVFAAAAMSLSSVSVVSNALRLRRFAPK
jgi:Cu+-exporting ATPase